MLRFKVEGIGLCAISHQLTPECKAINDEGRAHLEEYFHLYHRLPGNCILIATFHKIYLYFFWLESQLISQYLNLEYNISNKYVFLPFRTTFLLSQWRIISFTWDLELKQKQTTHQPACLHGTKY